MSLKWLNSIKSPSGRIARWAVFLQQFDFEVQYRRGSLNKLADSLSRNPLPTLNCVQLKETDIQCKWYKNKFQEVEKGPEHCPDYSIIDGRLHRHFWDSSDVREAGTGHPWKLCIPTEQRNEVLKENHDSALAGHLGIAKTIARISRNYYWPGMFRDIAKYVRNCTSCQKFKVPQQQLAGKMQPRKMVDAPFKEVSTDVVGPLPRSKKGNSYIVVMQDRFTKWVECRPVRKANAKTVYMALYEQVVLKYGCPTTVISDNGKQYDSRLFRENLQAMGINHQFTPTYTPQCNPVERANRTLKTMIAQFCEADHRNWDEKVGELTFAINTARQDSTGFTPAYLNYGRELRIPKAIYATEPKNQGSGDPNENTEEREESLTHRTEQIQHLLEAYEFVRTNLYRAFNRQAHNYNLRRREVRFQVGDQVLRRTHHLSSAVNNFASKLAPKFEGPFLVVKVISPVIYDLKDRSGKKVNHVHVKDLKPFHN